MKNGAKTDYWKTGHSYMKRRVNEIGALAGFEKSGHFFFNKPIGRGYDDGLIFALAVCDMLDRNPGKSMADLKNALPKTWSSPTMSPHCADETKYGIVDQVVKHFEAAQKKGEKVAGQPIRDLVTVNGVRVTVEDGTWGLVRASSNKPELVVVVESPVSEARMRDMFKAVDARAAHPPRGRRVQPDDLTAVRRVGNRAPTTAWAKSPRTRLPTRTGFACDSAHPTINGAAERAGREARRPAGPDRTGWRCSASRTAHASCSSTRSRRSLYRSRNTDRIAGFARRSGLAPKAAAAAASRGMTRTRLGMVGLLLSPRRIELVSPLDAKQAGHCRICAVECAAGPALTPPRRRRSRRRQATSTATPG